MATVNINSAKQKRKATVYLSQSRPDEERFGYAPPKPLSVEKKQMPLFPQEEMSAYPFKSVPEPNSVADNTAVPSQKANVFSNKMPFGKSLNSNVDFYKNLGKQEEQKPLLGKKEMSPYPFKGGLNPLSALGYQTERTGSGLLSVGEGVTDFIGSNVDKAVSDVFTLGSNLFGGVGTDRENGVSKALYDTAQTFKKGAEKFYKDDFAADYEGDIQERYKPTKAQEKFGSVMQGAANMLPTMVMNTAVPGAGLPFMGTSAAGNSANTAFDKTGNIDMANAYGTLSGALEVGTEKMFGGIPQLNKGVISKAISNVLTKYPAVAKLIDLGGEGVEEAISTMLDPYLRRMTFDPNASEATIQEVLESALNGVVTSAMLQGSFVVGDKISSKTGEAKIAISPIPQGIPNKSGGVVLPWSISKEEKAAEWLHSRGLQLPKENTTSDLSNTIIPQGNNSVNSYDMQESGGNASGALGGVRVGKATIIKSPYKGETPTQLKNISKATHTPQIVSENAVNNAFSQIESAKAEAAKNGKSLRSVLSKAYDSLFEQTGGAHSVEVANIKMNGKNYIVSIGKKAVSKVISDPKLTAEKLAIFDVLDDVVENGEYVGSGEYVQHHEKAKKTIRFDYFETPVTINRKEYTATFDVEVFPGANNYRTHKIINNMDLAPTLSAEVGPVPTANNVITPKRGALSPSNNNIAQENSVVNSYDMQNSGENSGANDTSTFGKNSLGPAQRNPNSYSAKQNDYGTIEPGEKPFRVVDVPQSTEKGNKVRRFTRTVMEAQATPDTMLDAFETKVAEGFFSYKPRKDKTSLVTALKAIEDKGYQGALSQWEDVTGGHRKAGKDDIVLGETLYALAAKNGDANTAMKLAGELSAELTHAGQAVQAARLLKKSSPEGKLYYAKKSVENLQEELTNKYGEKAPELEIDKELIEDYLEAAQEGTEAEQDAILDEIYQNVAGQVSVTLADKWNAWRYLSMLGNTRTHIRNVVGNGLFYLTTKGKNIVGAGLESATNKTLSLLGKEQIERTKTVKRANKVQRDFAKSDYDEMKSVLTGSGKYNPSDIIKDKRKIFKSKLTAPIEAARKLNNWGLEAEDAFFLKLNYVDSMSKYLSANKLVPNAITEAQLETARGYALNEAQRATFRDSSKLASVLNRATNTNAFTKVLLGGTIPFTKTPINIAKRAIEYSPVGAVKAVKEMLVDVRRRDKTAAEAIDGLASGLAGSGIMALGFLLAQMGLVSGGNDEDTKQEGFDRLQGAQNYALQTADGSYTIDWAAPTAIPLFMGVELFNLSNSEGNAFENIINSITSLSDPLVEMSVLQGINSTINTVKYEENPLSALLMNSVANYAGQAVPTAFGHIARAVDDTRRSTYIEKGKIKAIDSTVQKSLAKIPFGSKSLQPMVDNWGREVKNEGGNGVSRYLYNSLSPGYYKGKENTPLDTELERIYKSGVAESPYPTKAEKSFRANGETVNLTADEYTKYAKEKGSLSFELANKLITDKGYAALPDEDKAALIREAYGYANAIAKSKVSDYELSDTYKKMYEAGQKKIEPYKYLYIKKSADADGNGSITQEEMKTALDDTGLTNVQKAYMWAVQNKAWKTNPYK